MEGIWKWLTVERRRAKGAQDVGFGRGRERRLDSRARKEEENHSWPGKLPWILAQLWDARLGLGEAGDGSARGAPEVNNGGWE